MLVTLLKSLFSVLILILTMLVSPGMLGGKIAYEPKDEGECLLNIAVISDTHLDGSAARQAVLELALDDIAMADYPVDLMIISGDITDNGETDEWDTVAAAFANTDYLPEIILAEGNHDTWADDGYEASLANFLHYNEVIAGRTLEKQYYSTAVGGYTFVVMGSEADHTDAYISDEQLGWLDATLSEASVDGKPIFVISHWPMNLTHGLPESWGDEDYDEFTGGFGEQSAQVEEILQKYENIFFISGHIHNGLGEYLTDDLYGYKSVEHYGNIHSINMPSYMYMYPHGQVGLGNGFQFEVYADRVVVRARNYATGIWFAAYDYEIPLS
ncbi:MAG: metallophosphoesterase [Clostridia bacterium]|nr:metallophosphoesterase [Clostridia bacterium]